MPLNVLIIGVGVGGPTFAALLQGSDHRHNITVVERAPTLRLTGQQIDLKAHGIPIVRKMSLLDTVKSHCVAEYGIKLVDGNGKSLIQFNLNDSNKGTISRSVTSEYEIMRGDLVKVMYDAGLNQRASMTKCKGKEGGLTYEFGKSITELNQNDDGVNVTFSDGQKRRYDIVVGADGQGSLTRRLAFGQAVSDGAFKSLGTQAAFYSIPRVDGEGEIAKAYIAPGRRGIMTRTGDRPVTQVFLFSMSNTEKLKKVMRAPVEKQKEAWAETFRGAGWQTPRFLSELKTCNDFYACELAQVKLKQLYQGRVVLLGDAGYCPSVMTGLGTTAALVGAYVLAGELARHGNDVGTAFKAYERVMQAPILEYQRMPFGGLPGAFWPSSRPAIWILHNTLWAISTFKIGQLIQRMLPKDNGTGESGWSLPDYPELNLKS
jgi:2-polyprenyl-6-methoxyphenol hydroxylase-like FAD-dependent oxidoreductase